MTVTGTSAPDPDEEFFSVLDGAMLKHVSSDTASRILQSCPRNTKQNYDGLIVSFVQRGKVDLQERFGAEEGFFQNYSRLPGTSFPKHKTIAASASSPPPLVDDAVGCDGKPDPLTFTTEEELIAGLRAFALWAGDFTSRQLAKWSGNVVSHMTIHNLLAENPRKRPPLKLVYVQAIVRGCGGSTDDIARWTTAWRRVRRGAGTSSGTGENNVISLNKRAATSG